MKTRNRSNVALPSLLLAIAGLALSFPAWSAGEDGSLLTNRFTASLGTFRHFGVGACYNRFGVDVDVNRDAFRGSLEWDYSGAQIHVTATF